MNTYQVVIVGAGPGGTAAALRLAARGPALAAQTLVLDRAVFPRRKLCGGGVTQHGWALLDALGVAVDVPAYPVHHMRLIYRDLEATFHWRNVFRIVQRDEFDLALLNAVAARGVAVRQGVTLREIHPDGGGVTLVTDAGELRTRVVIGADGANSVVRQKLGLSRPDRVSRLMEVLTPVADPARTPEFAGHTAVFDFTPIAHGVQGYYWDFPAYREGQAVMNRGLYDSRVRPDRPRADLKPVLAAELEQRRLELGAVKLMGHPERWFDPRERHAVPGVVLAGDAAGTEPWLGEGISHALDFGTRAADAVCDAFQAGDFSFSGYSRAIAESSLGRRLRLKRWIAHYVYGNRGEWFYRTGWRMLQLGLPVARRN